MFCKSCDGNNYNSKISLSSRTVENLLCVSIFFPAKQKQGLSLCSMMR